MYFILVLINKSAILRGQNLSQRRLVWFRFLAERSSKQSSTVDLENWHRYSFILITLETREEDIKTVNIDQPREVWHSVWVGAYGSAHDFSLGRKLSCDSDSNSVASENQS